MVIVPQVVEWPIRAWIHQMVPNYNYTKQNASRNVLCVLNTRHNMKIDFCWLFGYFKLIVGDQASLFWNTIKTIAPIMLHFQMRSNLLWHPLLNINYDADSHARMGRIIDCIEMLKHLFLYSSNSNITWYYKHQKHDMAHCLGIPEAPVK